MSYALFSQLNQNYKWPQRYVRPISINFDRVDAVLGQASCLEKWAVVTQLHALAREVVPLEQLHPVVLSMLGG